MAKLLKGRGLPLEQSPILIRTEGASRFPPGRSVLFPESWAVAVSSDCPLAENTRSCLWDTPW